MGPFGMQEILLVAGIAILIFGPKQLPKLGKSLGESIRAFRDVGKQITEAKDEVEEVKRDLKNTLR